MFDRAKLRAMLNPRVRRVVRDGWEDLRDWIDAIAFGLRSIVAGKRRPRLLLYFGFAPGDDLLCTAVLRELRKRDQDEVFMISNHRELYIGNNDPADVIPLWRRYYPDRSTTSVGRRFARWSRGKFVRLEYAPTDTSGKRVQPSRHVITEMCARASVTGPVSIRPYLNLTEQEKLSTAWAAGCVVVQSSGMAARFPAQNKEWRPGRFQAVVDLLAPEMEFVQLGSAGDPLLSRTKDLRGATTMRESAAILYQARLFVGLEGFLMHLARAVDCPSVIVFGGRVAPSQIGYICNSNLYSSMPCAPCWRWNDCDFDRKCMTDISVADVVSAIRDMLAKPRGPLPVETAIIATDNRDARQRR